MLTTHKFVVIMSSSFDMWKQQWLMATWQHKVFDTVDEMNIILITNKDMASIFSQLLKNWKIWT
jgi:hypothetical protein